MTARDASSADQALRTIGFIGLGKMGQPMATNLISRGFELVVFDADLARTQALCEQAGARAADQVCEVGPRADALITMLPDGAAVRSVLLDGEPNLAGSLRAGALVIDMSSSAPHQTIELGRALETKDVGLIDAPVSGGVKRAVDATLSVMVGGGPAEVTRARPVLEAMAETIIPTGALGTGHAMKALNNYVSSAGLIAAIEAVQVGAAFGLNPEVMVDILNVSTGRNNSTELKLKQQVLSGAFNSGFALGLMSKDVATAHELARRLGHATPLADACTAIWKDAEDRIGGTADHTAIARYLQELS